MMKYRDARNFFQEFGGFTEKGMETEWNIFLDETGDKSEYSKREILIWLGY